MNVYQYYIEDGQFSFDFEAPLLGYVGDYINIYDASQMDNGQYEIMEFNRIHILDIDFDNNIVSCSGSVSE